MPENTDDDGKSKGEAKEPTPIRENMSDFPVEMWQNTSEWINIPLDPNKGDMVSQIDQFFEENKLSEGEGTLTWEKDFKKQQRTIPTIDIRVPRDDPSEMQAESWIRYSYDLPDGSEHVRLLAERLDTTTQEGDHSRSAMIHLAKEPGETTFAPIAYSEEERQARDNPYIRVSHFGFLPGDIGRELRRFEREGATNIKTLRVYNNLPPHLAPVIDITSKRGK